MANAKLTSLLPLPYADNLIERRTEKLVRLTFSNKVYLIIKYLKTSLRIIIDQLLKLFPHADTSNANSEAIKMIHLVGSLSK